MCTLATFVWSSYSSGPRTPRTMSSSGIPDRKVLFTGDIVFNGGTPFALAGSVAGWRDTLVMLRKLGAETVVPGTARSAVRSLSMPSTATWPWIQDIAAQGSSPERLRLSWQESSTSARSPDLATRNGSCRTSTARTRNFAAKNAAKPMGMEVFAEMITFNGGPVRCLA